MPSKRRKVVSSSQDNSRTAQGSACKIQRKYCWLQLKLSPLSIAAQRMPLSTASSVSEIPSISSLHAKSLSKTNAANGISLLKKVCGTRTTQCTYRKYFWKLYFSNTQYFSVYVRCMLSCRLQRLMHLSRWIWTPLKLVSPGMNFSEIFGPTLKNLFPL